jgi:hypothetical protein
MIAQGGPSQTGFADQSRLTGHFAARLALTPGRWAALAQHA